MCSLNQVAVVGVLHVYLSLSRMEVTARVKIIQKWIACSRQTPFLYQVCDEIRPSQRTLASSVDRLQQGDLSLCNTRRIVPMLRQALWYEKLTCYFPASSYKMRFLVHFEIKLDIYGNSWNQTWNQPWFQKKKFWHIWKATWIIHRWVISHRLHNVSLASFEEDEYYHLERSSCNAIGVAEMVLIFCVNVVSFSAKKSWCTLICSSVKIVFL